jgi:hypothetical protein
MTSTTAVFALCLGLQVLEFLPAVLYRKIRRTYRVLAFTFAFATFATFGKECRATALDEVGAYTSILEAIRA